MGRRLPAAGVLLAVAALTIGVTGAAGVAQAGPKPATSLALIGLENGQIQVIKSLSNGSPSKLGTVTYKYSASVPDAAISANGTRTLFATAESAVGWLRAGVRTRPTYAGELDLSEFHSEGGSEFHFFADAVVVSGNSALVSSDSQGVAQLIWKHGAWRIDTRVHFPGKNEEGFARKPGFIRFPKASSDADLYEGLALGPALLPNGKVVAIAGDRDDGTIAVIEGVGTAKPKVAVAVNPAYDEIDNPTISPFTGSAGFAFSPATSRRAVTLTATGFSVINLANPLKPKVQSATTVGTPAEATSIAVSADGNHVVEGVGDFAYVYSGLLTASAGHPLTPVATIDLGDPNSGVVYDVGYLANNTLAVVHGDSTDGFHLTAYDSGTSAAPVKDGSVTLASEPSDLNSMSVWPANKTAKVGPSRLLTGARVGKHASQKLSVSDGVGHYSFSIMGGKLPSGLKLHGATISGTPRHAGTTELRIRASNQYGGAVFRSYSVTVGS